MTIEQRAYLLAALLLCACGDKATKQPPRRVPAWAVAVGDKYDVDTGLPLEVKDRATGIVLILVPPTTFIMGIAKANDGFWCEDGRPIHKVRITKPYYIGKYEVTRAQWAAMGGPDPSWRGQSVVNTMPEEQSRDRPIVQITWKEAHDVIAKHGFRLPTEAEWECACAAERPLPNLHELEPDALDDVAWYQYNADYILQPVGMKRPNALGIHDLQGNAREYCQDYYDEDAYKKRKGPVTLDPRGPASWKSGKPKRVFRGGAVQDPWWALSIADRGWAHDDLNPGSTGVRVVRDPSGGDPVWENKRLRQLIAEMNIEIEALRYELRQRPFGEVTDVLHAAGKTVVEFRVANGDARLKTGARLVLIRGLKTYVGAIEVTVASKTRGRGVVVEFGTVGAPRDGDVLWSR